MFTILIFSWHHVDVRSKSFIMTLDISVPYLFLFTQVVGIRKQYFQIITNILMKTKKYKNIFQQKKYLQLILFPSYQQFSPLQGTLWKKKKTKIKIDTS